MFDILEKCLESTKLHQVDLIQVRGQKRVINLCSTKNNAVEDLSNIFLSGMSAKVLVDGKSWGFSSTNALDAKNSMQAVKDAEKLARAATRAKKERLAYEAVSAVQIDISAPSSKPIKDISSEEIIKIPLEACKGARESTSGILLVEANFISIEDEKYFLSSEGSRIRQKISRVMLYVDAIARCNGDISSASESIGYTGGLEIFDDFSPHSLGKKVAEKANRLLSAKRPPSGRFKVIIHPTLCATLLHEAIGHPLEADLAMTGGGFSNRINEHVSSELITIYDDGQIEGGLGFLPYDDEGIESNHSVLIENGVLRSYMHDRTTAASSGVPPTGNAHAWDYSVEPLIRQTNIGIEAGDWSMEEMIEDVKEGLFLQGTFGGQANVNADFTFGFQNAALIRNGQQAEELRGANVAGNAIEVFQTIDAVGQKAVLRPGACGKSQWAIQGRVVPAIRCEIMVGGTGGK